MTRLAPSIDDFVMRVVRGRLARPDLVDLLARPDDEETNRLAAEVARLRDRLRRIEGDYDADRIDGRRYAVAVEKVNASLAAAEHARARLLGDAGLGMVLRGRDPAAAFAAAPLGVQRAVLDALAKVTLHPAARGHKFDAGTVDIVWRDAR